MMDFYDLGYQAGAADLEPSPQTDQVMTDPERREFIDGWVLGQAKLARALRKWWALGDPGVAPSHKP